jgi:hypothetical protein
MNTSAENEQVNRPRGVFRGCNFVTPDIVSYHRIRGGYAELASGSGILDPSATLWGVTVRNPSGNRLYPDPSRMFHSREEAEQYIESMQ